MKNIYVSLLVVILLLTIGCIGQQVELDMNNGLRINEFSVDPSIVEYDDVVRFFIDIENVGGTTANCVKAELYGVDSWYDITGAPISYPLAFGGEFFNFRFSNMDGNLRICYQGNVIGNILGDIFDSSVRTSEGICYTRVRGDSSISGYISGMWSDFSGALCNAYESAALPTVKVYHELTPPYPARNKPGQFVTAEWNLLPPELPQGIEVAYPVTARVSYWYTSTASMNVRAFNKEEYRRRQDIGEQTEYAADMVNSPGSPIKVVLQKGTSPIIVNHRAMDTGGSPIELVNYLFEFQNVGDGFPLPIQSDLYGRSGLIFGSIELRGPGAFFYDCMGQQHLEGKVWGDELFISGELARLRSDNTVPVSCTIGIDRATWIDRPTDTISMIFTLDYVYYIDKEVNVRVLGLEEPIY